MDALARTRAEMAALGELWHSGHPDRRGIWLAYEDNLFEEILLMTEIEMAIANDALTFAEDSPLKTITREAYAARFNEILAKLSKLTQDKNANYANDADAFANFRLIEHMSGGRVSTADGLLTRMGDKLQRLVNLSGGARNNFESFEDNCIDLAVYAIILLIHAESQAGAKK